MTLQAPPSRTEILARDVTGKISAFMHPVWVKYFGEWAQSSGGAGFTSGTFALRPSASGLPGGTMYYATDQGFTYVAVSESWQLAGATSIGPVALTNTVLKNLFSVALPASGKWSGHLLLSLQCDDGTDVQARDTEVSISMVNKAGAFTSTATAMAFSTAGLSAGTLAVATTLTAGTNAMLVGVTGTSSLTPTSLTVRFILCTTQPEAITLL